MLAGAGPLCSAAGEGKVKPAVYLCSGTARGTREGSGSRPAALLLLHFAPQQLWAGGGEICTCGAAGL